MRREGFGVADEPPANFTRFLLTKKGQCSDINGLSHLLGRTVGLTAEQVEYFVDGAEAPDLQPSALLHTSLLISFHAHQFNVDIMTAMVLGTDTPLFELPQETIISRGDPVLFFVSQYISNHSHRVFFELHERQPALEMARASVELNPDGVAERRNLGTQLVTAAEENLIGAVLLERMNAGEEARALRSEANEYTRQARGILSGLQRALLGTPGEIEIALTLADSYRSDTETGIYRRTLDDIGRRYPDHPETLFAHFRDKVRRGNSREAARLRDRLFAALPPEMLAEPFAFFYLSEKKYEEVDRLLKDRCEKGAPINSYLYLAWAQLGLGDYSEAIRTLDQGLKRFPRNRTLTLWLDRARRSASPPPAGPTSGTPPVATEIPGPSGLRSLLARVTGSRTRAFLTDGTTALEASPILPDSETGGTLSEPVASRTQSDLQTSLARMAFREGLVDVPLWIAQNQHHVEAIVRGGKKLCISLLERDERTRPLARLLSDSTSLAHTSIVLLTIAAVSRSARDLQKLQYSLFGNQSQTAAGIAVPITGPASLPSQNPVLQVFR